MLKAMVNTKNPTFWVLLHVVLGFGFVLARPLFVVWFAAFVLSSLGDLQRGSKVKRAIYLVQFITYGASLELLSRMTRAYKYGMPWEYGKYFVFVGALFGVLVLSQRRGLIGFLLFVLLLPGMFFSPLLNTDFKQITFNLLGPMTAAFAVLMFRNLPVTKKDFLQTLKLMLYPAITVLAYTMIKTPDFKNIDFQLGANFEAAGGFGSNQVSTILGFGMLLSFIFWINRWKLTGYRWADLGLVVLFAFQGLLTFSRGGIIGGGLSILVILFFYSTTSPKARAKFKVPKVGVYIVPMILSLYITFTIVDNITGGLLALRYSGESNATLRGTREKDLNLLTSGRLDIFYYDLNVWSDNFILGVGAGGSKLLRTTLRHKGEAAHVELSRLLSEHGLLGLLYFLILIYLGIRLFKRGTNTKYQAILLAIYMLAIYTTFHAAMRTYLTPLLIGIALIHIHGIDQPENVGRGDIKLKPNQNNLKQVATS